MDKLKMKTPDISQENIDKIAKFFPQVITEKENEDGEIKKAIDFDILRQCLETDLVEGDDERYRLDWPGKRASILKANTSIDDKTLRPEHKESVNFNNTENIYIEGDNFQVLKLLQESYLNKVKMIYIDPPYNTGKDFVYRDNFTQDKDEYNEEIGAVDEDGNKLFKNTETNGRFHSDWLSMMYERLIVAKDLLREDGVIFISIDDNEVSNLRKICDEVFGEGNFVSQIIWEKKYGIQNDAKWFSISHDYILIYSKNKDLFRPNLLPRTEEQDSRYKNPDNDSRGPWKSSDLSVARYTPKDVYEIITPSGRRVMPPKGRSWRTSKEKFVKLVDENRIWFGSLGGNVPSVKKFLSEVKDGITPKTIWYYSEVGHTDKATKELRCLFGTSLFDYPKPIDLIKRSITLSTKKNDIVLDFFSGSATTAHAVMELNAEDGGNRKFIMVQLAEEVDENAEAFKAGYKTIADIGKERIRRAAKKIIEDNKGKDLSNIDFGFRVFKLDSTNMKDVYYTPSEMSQSLLSSLEDNVKEDRTPEDLLTQVILDLGLELSHKIETKEILGQKIFFVENNSLVACFDEKINFSIVNEIAKAKPLKVVFRDASFKDDKDRINVEERFKSLSPETSIKVI